MVGEGNAERAWINQEPCNQADSMGVLTFHSLATVYRRGSKLDPTAQNFIPAAGSGEGRMEPADPCPHRASVSPCMKASPHPYL